jgi:hypothetical protein
MSIDIHFNDGDLREDYGCKKLTERQLKVLREYLVAHDPNWESKSGPETVALILRLFPEQKKAEKSHISHGKKHVQRFKAAKDVS